MSCRARSSSFHLLLLPHPEESMLGEREQGAGSIGRRGWQGQAPQGVRLGFRPVGCSPPEVVCSWVGGQQLLSQVLEVLFTPHLGEGVQDTFLALPPGRAPPPSLPPCSPVPHGPTSSSRARSKLSKFRKSPRRFTRSARCLLRYGMPLRTRRAGGGDGCGRSALRGSTGAGARGRP